MKRKVETSSNNEGSVMLRSRRPDGRNISPGKYPANRFGEEGAPGYMLAPEGCNAKRHNFPRIGLCVDLSICSYYCKQQCEKYLLFRKNAGVKDTR